MYRKSPTNPKNGKKIRHRGIKMQKFNRIHNKAFGSVFSTKMSQLHQNKARSIIVRSWLSEIVKKGGKALSDVKEKVSINGAVVTLEVLREQVGPVVDTAGDITKSLAKYYYTILDPTGNTVGLAHEIGAELGELGKKAFTLRNETPCDLILSINSSTTGDGSGPTPIAAGTAHTVKLQAGVNARAKVYFRTQVTGADPLLVAEKEYAWNPGEWSAAIQGGGECEKAGPWYL